MAPASKPTAKLSIREQAIDWLLHFEDGPASRADRKAFEAWLAADPSHAKAYAHAKRLFGESSDALKADPADTREAIRRRTGTGATVPALLLAGFLLLGGLFLWTDGPMRLRADALSGHHETPVVRLEDGSTIQLNADSAIAFDIGDRTRTVRLLRGEAWFDVASDPERPFVVEAGGERITVVGTVFDVNRMPGETEVTVAEGRVRVRAENGSAVLLTPQMRARVSDGAMESVDRVASGTEATWRSGRLVFEDRSFRWVVANLSRRLPGRIVIASESIADRRLTGSLDLSDPDNALVDLTAALGLRTASAGAFLTVVY
ncbi:FecR family protein [Amorphus coralli]|uniref:FecR family protein n=1 Tax=Amorphus coralli TaxID=340680 RepID=UPI000364FDF1|nr:FecR domain-containing protein [Amorphus coralli]